MMKEKYHFDCYFFIEVIKVITGFQVQVVGRLIYSSSKVIPSLLSEAASFIKVFLILRAGCLTLLSSCQHSIISLESPDKI